jgi:UbiD family decarboxylase
LTNERKSFSKLTDLENILLHADFVIEGYVDPREPLREEGPFGDHTGYYTLPEPYPVFPVTAITHRKDAASYWLCQKSNTRRHVEVVFPTAFAESD